MYKQLLSIIVSMIFVIIANPVSFAQMDIPQQLSYQGNLLESDKPVTGLKNFVFSFADTDWSEEHENVPVTKGKYFITLGAKNPIPLSIFDKNSSVRLKITVNGVALEPEILMLSTAYAFKAQKAVVADRLEGNSIYVNTSNYVGIGTDDPKEQLDINGGIKLGSTDSIHAGTIRWTGTDFEGYNGEKWLSLTQNNFPENGTVMQVVAGETLNGGETPVPVYMDADGLILSQTEGDSKSKAFNLNILGQTFKTDCGTHEIKSVDVNLEKAGNPSDTVELSIYAVYDNSQPTLNPLSTASIPSTDIVTGWNSFVFEAPVQVIPSTTYAIILTVPRGEQNDYINWVYSDTNVYNDGNYLESADYGKTWTGLNDHDFSFKIFSDNRVYACAADTGGKLNFIGFAVNSANAGEKVTVQTDGIVKGFNNLKIGKKYYVQNMGGIGLTPGLFKKLIAVAVNNSQLTIFWADSLDIATKEEALAGVNDRKIMTPKKTKDVINETKIIQTRKESVDAISDDDKILISDVSDSGVDKQAKVGDLKDYFTASNSGTRRSIESIKSHNNGVGNYFLDITTECRNPKTFWMYYSLKLIANNNYTNIRGILQGDFQGSVLNIYNSSNSDSTPTIQWNSSTNVTASY